MFALAALACSSDPPAQKDTGVNDGSLLADGSTDRGNSDGGLGRDGRLADGRGDGHSDAPIEIRPDGSSASVSVTSGGTVSSGGSYTLQSTLGPGINIDPLKGGAFELRFNGSVLPW